MQENDILKMQKIIVKISYLKRQILIANNEEEILMQNKERTCNQRTKRIYFRQDGW